MATAYLGIGSNMGDRKQHIHDALNLLEQKNITVIAVSSLIETDPVGGPPQGPFLNGAIKIETDRSPHDLLSCLKSIEHLLGRRPSIKNGPRPIDIDILLYNNDTIKTPTLTIPHPRMAERDFVMQPLKEIIDEDHLKHLFSA